MADAFVVDASIVMAWGFKDETDSYPQKVLESFSRYAAVAPSVFPLEVCNVLVVAERKKRLNKTDSSRFLALLHNLPIVVDQEPPERMFAEILSLAREQGISTYDASYLDLAVRMGLPIATLDSALRKAAKRCNVPLFKPDKVT